MKILLTAFSVIFYVSSAFVLYFFARYLEEYLKLSGRMKKLSQTIVTAVCGAQIFFAAISPFTGFIFYINDSGYTMLPLRAVSEALGATVNWNDESRAISILSGSRIISMKIGEKTMYVNGTPIPMNTAPEISNGRTFIPVRDLANALGIKDIQWNEETSIIILN